MIAKDVPQLKHELSEIELTMRKLDVAVDFTPKGHCEITGRGIEHIWGVTRIKFRKESAALNNDKRVNQLKQRVFKIVSSMPMEIVQRCCRRTREHKLSYAALLSMNEKNEDLKLNDVEKMKRR